MTIDATPDDDDDDAPESSGMNGGLNQGAPEDAEHKAASSRDIAANETPQRPRGPKPA